MTERFSARLRESAKPVWQAALEHPFVRGIGDGTLDPARFAYWLRQDYLFLIDYARLFGVVASRAPDVDGLARFVGLAHSTLSVEMDLHRAYAARFGIAREALEGAEASPTTLGYVNFLLRTALLGSYAETLAALLPCMWGYCEIGQRLAVQPQPGERYREWIDMYSSAEFAQLSDACRVQVDDAARDAPPPELKRMQAAFVTSSRYEYQFWEAAWRLEGWPV